MDDKSDDQILIMEVKFEFNRQYSDEKTKKLTEDLILMIISMIDQIKMSK